MKDLSLRYISGKKLEEILGITNETRRVWRVKSFLRPDKSDAYTVPHIDSFLERQARGFRTPPTVVELLGGKVRLLKSPQVRERLGIDLSGINRLINGGELAAVKLISEWRVDEASVEAHVRARQLHGLYLRKEVATVLSVTVKTVKDLIGQDRLQCCRVKGNGSAKPITRESLLELLSGLLPDWIAPEDWLEDRLISRQPLLTYPQARVRLGVNQEGLQTLLELRQVQSIRRLGSDAHFISPESADAYIEYNDHMLSSIEVASLYGVERNSVYPWQRAGLIVCPIAGHQHPDAEWLLGSCWLAILQRDGNSRFQPRHWYHLRRSGRSVGRTLQEKEMAAELQINQATLHALIQAGEIAAFRTPAGEWRFSRRAVEKTRWRRGA